MAASGVAVSIRGLRKNYGSQTVLAGLDLDVLPGEIFVLMGPSGAGKSVLLRQLIALDSPDDGEIRIGDAPVDDSIRDRFRMAFVFQSGGLLNSLTVGENVGLYQTEHRLGTRQEREQRVVEMLHNDPQMRAEFLNRVAAPIANKLFECGMIP